MYGHMHALSPRSKSHSDTVRMTYMQRGRIPLHFAKATAMMQLLLDNGAYATESEDESEAESEKTEAERKAETELRHLHLHLGDGDRKLHHTVSTVNIEDDETRVAMCTLLLQRKANPEAQDLVSWSPRSDGAVYGIRCAWWRRRLRCKRKRWKRRTTSVSISRS